MPLQKKTRKLLQPKSVKDLPTLTDPEVTDWKAFDVDDLAEIMDAYWQKEHAQHIKELPDWIGDQCCLQIIRAFVDELEETEYTEIITERKSNFQSLIFIIFV